MAAPLYRRHASLLAATYENLENHALSQAEVVIGTPGAITLRKNAAGLRFYVRQYYDHDGRKRDQYLAAASQGKDEDPRLEEWRTRLREAKDVGTSVRLLAREGFASVGPKHFAAVGTLCNQGLFRSGAVLVGTRAYEVIANRMGIRTAAFAVDEVDIAGPAKLAPESMARGGLPVNFEPVSDLKAHENAAPFLRYLIATTQDGAVLSRHGVAAVRVPLPERFALHKLLVAGLRTGRPQRRDLQQAAALIAALGDLHSGALAAAYRSTPVAARRLIRAAIRQLAGPLKAHPRAWEELADVAKA